MPGHEDLNMAQARTWSCNLEATRTTITQPIIPLPPLTSDHLEENCLSLTKSYSTVFVYTTSCNAPRRRCCCPIKNKKRHAKDIISMIFPQPPSFGPLLPAATMAPLLPLPDHLGHALHRLPPLLQTALERALPELTLDPLADARALDPQAVLDALLLLDLGVLGRVRHERQDVVFFGQLEELGLSAQGVVRRVPVAGAGVLEG